jgi:serine/threonine protein kinase
MDVQLIPCDRQAIERLLADRLSDSELKSLEAHLDGCLVCRQCLDDLAADGNVWQEAREFLSDGESPTIEPGDSVSEPNLGALAGLRAYLTPTDDPRLLGRLGGYGVVGLIGCGGFGVVLKAFDAALNRYVAIKALSPQLALSGAARQRFAREARAAAAVVHDHVVAIHAVAESDGLPYFVMPYVSGPSLEKRLRQNGPLAVVEILRIGMQIAAGLAAAHAQGLVHRDIKPANILLEDGAERVTITDFGLARAVDDASLTKSGVIAGTPPYMSPEQAAGLAVDHRSDLFSLGSVLYAMCTGRPPFRADTTLAVLRRVEECRPRPIREVNPEIPPWLAGIVGKLHAKESADRFQSAAEVADLLERCLANVQQPDGHPLPSVAAALGRPARSRKSWLAAALVAAALVAWPFWLTRHRPSSNEGGERSLSLEQVSRFDDDINKVGDRVRTNLRQLRLSLANDAPAADLLGPAIAGLRQRADALRQTMDGNSDPAVDRFAADVEDARRRLAALGQQAGPGNE